MSKHEIDDATFVRAFGAEPRGGMDLAKWEKLRFAVATYLAELPEPEPEPADRIEALATALGALVDNDISYNDRDLVIRCANHGEAMHKVFEARAILAKVRG